MKKKKTIIVIFIVIVLIIITVKLLITNSDNKNIKYEEKNLNTTKYYVESENNIKINMSSELNKEKNYNGMKIRNIQLKSENHTTQLFGEVENESKNDINTFSNIDIIFYDINHNEITRAQGLISPLKKGEKTQLIVYITQTLRILIILK